MSYKNREQHNEYHRQYRYKNREKLREYYKNYRAVYREKNRKDNKMKEKARSFLAYAIKKGLAMKKNCEKCGSKLSEGHHSNYFRPLSVVWLCRDHHAELHRKLRTKLK